MNDLKQPFTVINYIQEIDLLKDDISNIIRSKSFIWRLLHPVKTGHLTETYQQTLYLWYLIHGFKREDGYKFGHGYSLYVHLNEQFNIPYAHIEALFINATDGPDELPGGSSYNDGIGVASIVVNHVNFVEKNMAPLIEYDILGYTSYYDKECGHLKLPKYKVSVTMPAEYMSVDRTYSMTRGISFDLNELSPVELFRQEYEKRKKANKRIPKA